MVALALVKISQHRTSNTTTDDQNNRRRHRRALLSHLSFQKRILQRALSELASVAWWLYHGIPSLIVEPDTDAMIEVGDAPEYALRKFGELVSTPVTISESSQPPYQPHPYLGNTHLVGRK